MKESAVLLISGVLNEDPSFQGLRKTGSCYLWILLAVILLSKVRIVRLLLLVFRVPFPE